MEALSTLATQTEDLRVEYEVLLPYDLKTITDERRKQVLAGLQGVEAQLELCQKRVEKLNNSVDALTNHADQLDYTISVASGVLTGLIDSFFVGKLDLKECHDWGSDKVNDFIKRVGGSDDLEKAIKNLEDKSKAFFPSDPNLNDFGGGLQHHLRDFAHHPTPVGLAFSLLTQFTYNCYGTDVKGHFIVVPVKDRSRIGETVPQKILFATVYWFFHLVSDMAGTSSTAGGGTGLPGPLLAFAKELSALPFFQNARIGDMELSLFISKLFNGTLFAERDEAGKIIKETVAKLDLRTELGMLHQQMFPVLLNEILVRVFYSARRVGMELQEKDIVKISDIRRLNWRKILPVGNRTVERMITISSGTFMAVDLADAAIRSGIEAAASGSAAPITFAKGMILRVNFVGIGRFSIAVVADCAMGAKLRKKRNEQVIVYTEMMELTHAKMYYKEADMWISAQDAGEIVSQAYAMIPDSARYFGECWISIQEDLNRIPGLTAIEQNNPGLNKRLLDILEWE